LSEAKMTVGVIYFGPLCIADLHGGSK